MVVGEIAEGVDLLVVGAGPAGYAAALRGAQLGRDVTLVDRDGEAGVGGVCLRVGCIPSKALIEFADVLHRANALGRGGLAAGGVTADLAGFQRHKAGIVAGLTGGVRGLLRDAGVPLVGGTLRFTRPDQAVVETTAGQARFFEFQDVVLATGSRPVSLPSLPFDGITVLDSTGALALDALPSSVAVVGAGYIGVELGTALAKLGVPVTIVEQAEHLLPGVERALSRPVSRRLAELGVDLLTAATARAHADGVLTVERGGEQVAVKAEKVIVAVGRQPNTDQLGLDRLGVTAGSDGLLPVGPDRLVRRHVAAIGDITPGPALAHKGYAEAGVAVENLSGRRAAFQPAAIPAVVFSDPEIATVGLTAAEAAEQGIEVAMSSLPMAANGRAMTIGAQHGTVQLVTDRGSGVVLGVHLVGPHASELIAEATLALEMGATAEDLAETIHVHPSVSEHLEEAARATVGRPINSPSQRPTAAD
ncbi:dihydrolipoyl dehydrogenase [Parafrankia sp. EUN1f]|uniref:dihydrolipoyl dehydrogenase n=1 Tax=Parafrankia sp. EUN1f TaxID=102897 RepID=UPI0001C46360|nr:dihydrolipoyl dehydrogenase [Parafrankia sp. EUN1f]EFC81432.1 dihydrolipoamide dehydrogenase [Parafrankia sp. EUN1f]